MPFTRKELDDFQSQIRLALASTSLSEWERSFLRGIKNRFDKHGTRTNLSKKQYRQLVRLTSERSQTAAAHENRLKYQPPRGKQRRPSHKRHKRQKSLGDKITSAFVIFFVGGFLLFKACERFPEFLGPLVALTSTQKIVGPVTRVRDGDTIEVKGVPIRFGSLNCAERGTTKGRTATGRMQTLVKNQILVCHLNGRTSYDRKIGSCRLGDGRDLGGIMIREGVCRRFW